MCVAKSITSHFLSSGQVTRLRTNMALTCIKHLALVTLPNISLKLARGFMPKQIRLVLYICKRLFTESIFALKPE